MSAVATMDALEVALTLAKAGLSVIPIRADGLKRPARSSWAEFQTRRPTDQEIRSMFQPGLGVAIVAGEASGNLEVLDIESGAPFAEYLELVRAHDDQILDRLPHVETPSGGHHLFFRCDEVSGNQKLAMEPDASGRPEVLFETRGIGGYVLTIGSPAECHQDRREYRLVSGRLTQIPRITPAQRSLLLDAARSFNRIVRQENIDRRPSTNGNGNGTRPGDIFNANSTWNEILAPHGWAVVGTRGEEALWRRPGKDFSFSATTNYKDSDVLYVFSTNAYPFEHETAYSKFRAHAILNHSGDYKAAARALAQQYGMKDLRAKDNGHRSEEQDERAAIQAEPVSQGEPPVQNDESNVFQAPSHWKWLDVAKLHDWNCLPLRWNIRDLIAQGNFVIIAAETQTGKTLFGLFVSQSMLHPGHLFGKYEISPVGKILYLGLEDPDRRFQNRLQDIESFFPKIEPDRFIVHIAPGFTLNDERMVEYLEQLITVHQFKVIFLDTYQKATPGLSSFGDEEQTPILHRLCNLTRKYDVTLIVMDHVRKRDGQQKKRNILTIDDIKGTGGKAQNADCVILMERTPDRKQVRFQSFSKDSDQPIRILLDVAPKGSPEPKFKYAGDLDQFAADAKARGNASLAKAHAAFRNPTEKLSSSTVAERAGFSPATARRYLADLVKSEKLDSYGEGRNKKYWLVIDQSAQEAV